MQHYSTEEGLALSSISCSCCDKSGNLWFGTSGGGLSCYNGKSFANYSNAQGLFNNSIECILVDRSGIIWIGTNGGGLCRYDGKAQAAGRPAFVNFTTAQGLLNNNVECLVQDQNGMIWLGTNGGGLSRYDGHSLPGSSVSCFINYTSRQGLAGDVVWSAAMDATGKLWFGTEGGGLSCFNNTGFHNYTTAQGLPGNSILTLHTAKNGDLWIGTNGNGACRYDGKTFMLFKNQPGLQGKRILSIGEDNQGNIWLGTDGSGLVRWSPDNKVLPGGKEGFSSLQLSQGLESNKVQCITTDHSGNLWFGTDGAGVACYNGEAFLNFRKEQGLANSIVWSVAEDHSGHLWFATDGGGLSELNPEESTFQNFAMTQGLVSNSILSVLNDSKGNLWIGSAGRGVNLLSADRKTMQVIPGENLAHASVLCMLEDRSGDLWFGKGLGGVCSYDGKKITSYNSIQGLADNSVQCLMQDKKGNIWLGTNGGGFFRYDGISPADGQPLFVNYSKIQGLVNNSVMCMLEDRDGQLWVGTNGGGLSRFNLSRLLSVSSRSANPGTTLCVNYTTADGLPDDAVTQLLQDKAGKIWVGTSKGIAGLIFKNNKPEFEVYNTRNGYPVKDVNAGQNSMFMDSKGMIWIGTGDDKTALVRFDPSALVANTDSPVLLIQSVKVNDQSVNFNPATTEVPSEKLVLPYENNNISFEFCAIEPARPKRVNYQYILEGYSKNWSAVTKSDKAGFGNIYEGMYTFRLKAQSPFGVWSDPISFTFKVLPPWYRTWWMYLVYGLLSLSLIWGINRWLTSQLRLQNQVLEFEQKAMRSQMNPHFIFNSLNSIQNYISGNDTNTAEIFLSRFARLIRNILSSSGKNFVLLADELKVMKDYLELEKLQYDNRFDFSFTLDPEIDPDNIEIPSMLIQPYLENAVLHGLSAKAEKGHVSVNIRPNSKAGDRPEKYPLLICEIQDDGIGREKAKELKIRKGSAHQSFAMSLTKERLELLNKKNKQVVSVHIEDLYTDKPAGTKIILSIPFREIS